MNIASSIVSLDGWYHYVLNFTTGIPMKIKKTFMDMPELLNGNDVVVETETIPDYDFVNDEIIEMKRSIDPMVIIPQDGLRFSIINILAYCMYILANEYMASFCDQYYAVQDDVKCLINLKNEFLN